MNATRVVEQKDGTEWTVIHTYTRAEAIADGVLVDLTARFPNDTRIFKHPVACTATVWALIETVCEAKGGDPGGYVWDMCFMAVHAGKDLDPTTRLFKCCIPLPGRAKNFKIVCGPGDEWEPVLTIMFPDED